MLASYAPLAIAFPLGGAVVLHFIGRRLGRAPDHVAPDEAHTPEERTRDDEHGPGRVWNGEPIAGYVASLAMLAAFVLSIAIFFEMAGRDAEERAVVATLFKWIPAGALQVDASFLVDQLSVTMMLVVTGVGFLIHVYSIGYMHGDPRFARFFCYLNLFAASMLILVMGSNFLVLFVGWELVGLCSFLLISFWFTRRSAAAAGKKAFVVNRVGDFGFLVATFLVYSTWGSLNFADVLPNPGVASEATLTGVTLLLLLGAAGKSAQLPLYVWLPDAMEGPTPVSALIHAATMVTAGVYMVARTHGLYDASAFSADVVAIVGAATALYAALIALTQFDIKRVLAYSTISQLGYMFLGVGLGAYAAGMFHLVTHAFFKALLFLAAGSVIHAMHDEQDMRRMGHLRRVLPVTYVTFLIGWLAIAGIPPFAGFFSKDEILVAALDKGGWYVALWAVGVFTAVLTAFYMSRQFFMVFHGPPGEAPAWQGAAAQPHESPRTMLFALVVLAGASIAGGVLNLPRWLPFDGGLSDWLEPVVGEHHEAAGGTELFNTLVLTALCVAGIWVAARIYLGRVDVSAWRRRLAAPVRWSRAAFGVDTLYGATIVIPGRRGSEALAAFDLGAVDGAVNGLGGLVIMSATEFRKAQTGYVREYGLAVLLGAVVITAIAIGVS